ncbi:ArsR family transcriptional regulator, partial [Xanthomonas cissicola]
MKERVPEVAKLLRFIATPSRLLLLCQLSQGEFTVSSLEATTGIAQPALSQQLADLRQRNL